MAPYATALAAMVDPRRAVRNLRRLAAQGLEGAYGFYEAIDYTHGDDERCRPRRDRDAPPRARSCAPTWPTTRA